MSELRTDTITASDGTSAVTLTKQSAAKAWAETASDGASILGSFGFSSITDTATGQQQMHLSNAMADVFYSRLATFDGSALVSQWTQDSTTTNFMQYSYNGSAYVDAGICDGVMGDLA